MNLKDGSRYILGIGSEGTIHRDRLVLLCGSADVVRTGRLVAAGLSFTSEGSTAAATVYLSGKDRVTLVVRQGRARVSGANGASLGAYQAGELVSWRSGKTPIQLDGSTSLLEVSRAQSDQVASLNSVTRNFTCLTPKAGALSKTLGAIASQLASYQASRAALQGKVEAGSATTADLERLNALDRNLGTLRQASVGLAADLSDVVFLHHVPPSHASAHSVHGHNLPSPHEHHGEHGHSVPFGGGGHHHIPPHAST